MVELEKVIKGIECHHVDNMNRINCADCPYYMENDTAMRCLNRLHDDALELLKEYKEAKPLIDAISDSVHETAKIFRQNDGLKHYDDGSSEP